MSLTDNQKHDWAQTDLTGKTVGPFRFTSKLPPRVGSYVERSDIPPRATDYDSDYVPRAFVNDPVTELLYQREENDVTRRRRRIRPWRGDQTTRQLRASILLAEAEDNNPPPADGPDADGRTIILTDWGIDIINLTYVCPPAPRSIKPAPIASPRDHPVYSASKHKALPARFPRTSRYGTWRNAVGVFPPVVVQHAAAAGREWVSKEKAICEDWVLRYLKPVVLSQKERKRKAGAGRAGQKKSVAAPADVGSPKVRQASARDIASPVGRQASATDVPSPALRQPSAVDGISPTARQASAAALATPTVRQASTPVASSPLTPQASTTAALSPTARQTSTIAPLPPVDALPADKVDDEHPVVLDASVDSIASTASYNHYNDSDRDGDESEAPSSAFVSLDNLAPSEADLRDAVLDAERRDREREAEHERLRLQREEEEKAAAEAVAAKASVENVSGDDDITLRPQSQLDDAAAEAERRDRVRDEERERKRRARKEEEEKAAAIAAEAAAAAEALVAKKRAAEEEEARVRQQEQEAALAAAAAAAAAQRQRELDEAEAERKDRERDEERERQRKAKQEEEEAARAAHKVATTAAATEGAKKAAEAARKAEKEAAAAAEAERKEREREEERERKRRAKEEKEAAAALHAEQKAAAKREKEAAAAAAKQEKEAVALRAKQEKEAAKHAKEAAASGKQIGLSDAALAAAEAERKDRERDEERERKRLARKEEEAAAAAALEAERRIVEAEQLKQREAEAERARQQEIEQERAKQQERDAAAAAAAAAAAVLEEEKRAAVAEGERQREWERKEQQEKDAAAAAAAAALEAEQRVAVEKANAESNAAAEAERRDRERDEERERKRRARKEAEAAAAAASVSNDVRDDHMAGDRDQKGSAESVASTPSKAEEHKAAALAAAEEARKEREWQEAEKERKERNAAAEAESKAIEAARLRANAEAAAAAAAKERKAKEDEARILKEKEEKEAAAAAAAATAAAAADAEKRAAEAAAQQQAEKEAAARQQAERDAAVPETPKHSLASLASGDSSGQRKSISHLSSLFGGSKRMIGTDFLGSKSRASISSIDSSKLGATVLWKGTKVELRVHDEQLLCTEAGKNKPYKHFFPVELSRLVSAVARGADVTCHACVRRKGGRAGSKFKKMVFTFPDGKDKAAAWSESLMTMSYAGSDPEAAAKGVLILIDKFDSKEPTKLVEKYLKPVLDAVSKPCDVKAVQFNEFSISNVLCSQDFARLGNIVCINNVDFVPRLQQVLVRNQHVQEPATLACEPDPTDLALGILRSSIVPKNGKKGSLFVTGVILKRDEVASSEDRVCIGGVCVDLTPVPANTSHKVPILPLLPLERQETLQHLLWMMRKEKLGQDVFLIGPPGPMKRHVALTYLNLTNREFEYVALHRDTSAESDLKQRREIVRAPTGGLTAQWVDGVAVRAAIDGRVLILEGIEKAERNVLPVLNNLLENREMNLEDGRHIVHPSRYDALLESHSKEELDSWRLVRASEKFRIIALGVPVPPYPGNSLDPPFRSRFASRYVDGLQLPLPSSDEPEVELLRKLQDVIRTIKYTHEIQDQLSISSTDTGVLLPQFPQTAMDGLVDLLDVFPEEAKDIESSVQRFWPASWVGNTLNNEQKQAWKSLMDKFGLPLLAERPPLRSQYDLVDVSDEKVVFQAASSTVELPIIFGTAPRRALSSTSIGDYGGAFVRTPRLQDIVTRMAQAHTLGSDMVLVGAKGSGKSTAAARFAALFGYEVETVHLFRDMSARDVLQRRETRHDGSTHWQNSPMIKAALEGKIAILDGLHWVRADTIAALGRLVQDREIVLPDGTQLIGARSFDLMAERLNLSAAELNARGVQRIHPSFRIIATSSVTLNHKAQKQEMTWLTEEVGAMFQFIEIGNISLQEESALLRNLTACPENKLKQLLDFAAKFRQLGEGGGTGHETILAKSVVLSTRQLLRICRRVAAYPDESLYTAIHRTCLSPFLPQLARQALEDVLADSGIYKDEKQIVYSIERRPETLRLGDVTMPMYVVPSHDLEARALIPHTAEGGPGFYDNEVHTRIMREIAVDFVLGEHLLLIGNQGVGKNKLTDRFLELVGRPREYIQLHRDSTVQSLTMQPVVENGMITYKDSPLVRAARNGRVLLVDEADKAPVYITSILKSLAETGEMPLGDGRRIRPTPQDPRMIDPERDIVMHPDFRMIVLANRPGYPFLGNDFFGAIGEVFSCHAVENPDFASELSLLKQSAPRVDPETLSSLIQAFGELRRAFDDGLVAYPYSLRELLNIVKHIQAFPDEPLEQVLRNVFDFDVHRKEFFEVLLAALNKHGLNISNVGFQAVKSASGAPGEEKKLDVKWEKGKHRDPADMKGPKHGKEDDKAHVGGNQWAGGSGGSDTAGIGGRGGPYRLHKKGQPIVRLSDEVKNAVPDHVREAARQMGREALAKRLAEINMSTHEAAVYKQIYGNVAKEIRQLKVILEAVRTKEKERTWFKGQTDGELDESKVIEALTGEKGIYKRRGEEDPDHGEQTKPKRLKFVFDVSASMYSYNAEDGRLNRSLETALMVMESLEGLADKYVYDIVGHSGDSECIVFVEPGKPPKNEMERMRVLSTMSAHSQYCFSGDTTLKATEKAIKDVAKDDADDYFTLVMSDANLRRYGIHPATLSKIIESDPKVNCAVLFIGSMGDEAKMLTRQMPPGKAFVALKTSDIPKIMKEIFTAIA
ncbi:hypothetical protein HDU88_000733 [Geranomyces variabilis]|nr:hypothetical protein HDU88_000733 [Geranomyces variabilis]